MISQSIITIPKPANEALNRTGPELMFTITLFPILHQISIVLFVLTIHHWSRTCGTFLYDCRVFCQSCHDPLKWSVIQSNWTEKLLAIIKKIFRVKGFLPNACKKTKFLVILELVKILTPLLMRAYSIVYTNDNSK